MKNKIVSRKQLFFYDLTGNQISRLWMKKSFFSFILSDHFSGLIVSK